LKLNNGEFSLCIERDGNNEYSYLKNRLCLIGKSQYCDFNAGVSDLTAAIYEKDNEMTIVPLDSKTSLAVNSNPIVSPRALPKNSIISMNEITIAFGLSNGDDSFEMRMRSGVERMEAERLVLLPAKKNSEGSRISMLYVPAPGKSVFVGRDATTAQMVINSKVVSKKHAQVISYENSILLLDCYSTNGTFVNGEKISKRTVHPGDIIEFGEEKFILSYV